MVIFLFASHNSHFLAGGRPPATRNKYKSAVGKYSLSSNDSNTMLAEGDFPPDLEASDVPFSVHQQNGEEKAAEKEGQDGQDECSEVENETTVSVQSVISIV
jgi:hypothetical protein